MRAKSTWLYLKSKMKRVTNSVTRIYCYLISISKWYRLYSDPCQWLRRIRNKSLKYRRYEQTPVPFLTVIPLTQLAATFDSITCPRLGAFKPVNEILPATFLALSSSGFKQINFTRISGPNLINPQIYHNFTSAMSARRHLPTNNSARSFTTFN